MRSQDSEAFHLACSSALSSGSGSAALDLPCSKLRSCINWDHCAERSTTGASGGASLPHVTFSSSSTTLFQLSTRLPCLLHRLWKPRAHNLILRLVLRRSQWSGNALGTSHFKHQPRSSTYGSGRESCVEKNQCDQLHVFWQRSLCWPLLTALSSLSAHVMPCSLVPCTNASQIPELDV